MDESSHFIAPNIKKGWYQKGNNIAVPINFTRKKFYSFGALGNDALECKFYDKANTDSFLDFVQSLQKQYGKVLLFADNVAYHKSNCVKKFLKKSKKTVMIRYFLPYTSELNPIEIQWREIKKNAGNAFFEDVDEMKVIVGKIVKSKHLPVVKLFKYLTP